MPLTFSDGSLPRRSSGNTPQPQPRSRTDIPSATGAIAEGIEAQAHQVFRNLTAVLQAAGSDMSKAVKTTVFIKNMDDFATVNAIYAGYFSEPFPARSCVEVARLPKDVLVECEVIAEA